MPSTAVTGNTTLTQPENKAFFPALDGIRAFAFLLVFAHHYVDLSFGWVGVDIFFVLSGFLITGILFDTRDSPGRVRNFYIRRSLRIFPLYYLVIFGLIAAAPIAHWQWDWRWLSWPLYVGNWVLCLQRLPLDLASTNLINGWLMTPHHRVVYIGHFWSLCVEEQFYLLWPWVVFQVRNRRALIAIAAAIIAISPVLRFYAIHSVPDERLSAGIIPHSTFFRLDTLMVGALVALLYRGEAATRHRLFRAAGVTAWTALLAIAVTLLALSRRPALLETDAFQTQLSTIGFTLIAFFAAGLIVRALIPGTLTFRLFSNTFLRWMGRITYGAYIFHDMPHTAYDRLALAAHMPTWPIALVSTFAISWLSFRFFESRFLNLKDRFTTASPA